MLRPRKNNAEISGQLLIDYEKASELIKSHSSFYDKKWVMLSEEENNFVVDVNARLAKAGASSKSLRNNESAAEFGYQIVESL